MDAAPVEVAREHDLALGDVAGEVGDRVRDVVGGHRQDRELRQRPRVSRRHPARSNSVARSEYM
jgi:hypothetical protein